MNANNIGGLLHGRPVMTMHSPLNKQGYLGNLKLKSKCELLDIIARQEDILKNNKFVESLPDKGKKIKNFLSEVKQVYSELYGKKNEPLKEQFNSEVTPSDINQKFIDELKIVEKGFMNIAVHAGPYYEVVKKAEREKASNQSKFKVEKLKTKTQNEVKNKELNSASYKEPKNGVAKVLPVEESCSIIIEQKRKCQELQLEKAAEMLLNSNENFLSAFSENDENKMDAISSEAVQNEDDEEMYMQLD